MNLNKIIINEKTGNLLLNIVNGLLIIFLILALGYSIKENNAFFIGIFGLALHTTTMNILLLELKKLNTAIVINSILFIACISLSIFVWKIDLKFYLFPTILIAINSIGCIIEGVKKFDELKPKQNLSNNINSN